MVATLLLGVVYAATATAGSADRSDDTNAVAGLRAKAIARLSGYTTPQLFDALQSKSTQWYEREALASELEKRPPEKVLPNLLPILFVPDPKPVAYHYPNSFEAAGDLPWPAPMRYTALAAWHQITRESQTRQKGMVLLKLLLEHDLPEMQTECVLDALDFQFIPEAESVLLQFVKNKASSRRECLLAARALLRHQGNKHYEHFVRLASKSHYTRKSALYKMLVSRIVKREEPDERVTRMGFELLRTLVARDPSRPRKAWELLRDIENYVGVKFYPYGDEHAYRLGHRGGLTEDYFQKGVDNAMRWWKGTKGRDSAVQKNGR
ncbi:MAG: hypothetical protein ACYTG0_30920 [Planctomycetota bacterium]|jgi:hypothetical protein